MKTVFAVALFLAGSASLVQAAAVGPEKATELLAHSWMIDNRCSVLDKDERDVLTGLVARAEISLAEKVSVKAARGAIARGRASGTAAPCDAQNAQVVKDTLKAATSAAAVSEMDVPESAVAAQAAVPKVAEAVEPEPVDDEALQAEQPAVAEAVTADVEAIDAPKVVRKPSVSARKVVASNKLKEKAKPPRVVAKREKPIVIATVTKRVPNANGYGATAENYYRELRCRRLSQRAVNAMYARVLREHRQAVSASGKAAVRRLLRAAEARASNGSC